MRFVSWNVNGLRAVMKKGFEDTFATLDADFFALQEIKLQPGQLELELPGYHQYYSYAERKGYSGTAVFSKHEPMRVLHGFSEDQPDPEGRICALEYPGLWFVCVYSPNSQDQLARINFRLSFEEQLRDFLSGLNEEKPVLMCGDLNVAHEEIDIKNPGPNRGNAGFSDEEREAFGKLLDTGFVDTFRDLHPDLAGAYSWWSYRFHARENNAGWRIDYFIASKDLAKSIETASIFDEVYGSDHCPVGVELPDSVLLDGILADDEQGAGVI